MVALCDPVGRPGADTLHTVNVATASERRSGRAPLSDTEPPIAGTVAGSAIRPGPRRAALAVIWVMTLLGVLAGCTETGPVTEVDDGSDSARAETAAPVFPDDGEVPRELLVEGLVFDLGNRPVDGRYWAAPAEQAECAAVAIVDTLGAPRLSELGYRPGVTGASLNDIELTDAERGQVVEVVEECVDMVDAVAAMFYGDGRIPASVADCLASGLQDRGQLRPFVVAVVFGTAVDPFAGGSALATAMLDQAEVCVPEAAFNWADLDLPGGPVVIDENSPGGVPGSPFPDDQPDP